LPLYEYQCAQCGRFEVIQKFSDSLLTACPTCGRDVHKLPSAPAIQFKGTGWYVTDYARKGAGGDGAKGAEGAKGADPAPGKDASGSSDSSTPKTASKESAATGSSPSKPTS
jgi:putative FmdB family regulatory protein